MVEESKSISSLVILVAGTFLTILNQTLVAPALSLFMHDFSIPQTTAQWMTSGYMLAIASVIPIAPLLLGKFGSRRLFLSTMAFFAVGSFLTSLAPSFPLVLCGRILQACAAGIILPISFTIMLVQIPREKRGTAMAIIMLAIMVAPALGPVTSGFIINLVGWRVLFVFVACFATLIFILGLIILKNNEFPAVGFDGLSFVLSTSGLVCLLYGFSSFSNADNRFLSLGLIGVGAVILGFFAYRQLHLENPLLNLSTLKTQRFRISSICILLVPSTTASLMALIPLFVQNLLRESALATGLVILPGAVAGAVAGLIAGRAFDRHGVRVCAVPGALLFAGGYGLAAITFNQSVPLPIVSLAYGIIFIGCQTINTTVGTWGLNALDNKDLAHAQAITNDFTFMGSSMITGLVISISSLGASLSGFPANSIDALDFGYHWGFIFESCVAIIAAVVLLVFVRDKKQTDTEESESEVKAHGETAAVLSDTHAQEDDSTTAPWHRVAQCMNREPSTLAPTDTIATAAYIMLTKNQGSFTVVDKDKRVVGFISEGDLTKYLAPEEWAYYDPSLAMGPLEDNESMSQRIQSLLTKTVGEIMTSKVVTLDGAMALGKACRIMADRRLKSLPVVDEQGHLVGTLSREDVVRSTLWDQIQTHAQT